MSKAWAKRAKTSMKHCRVNATGLKKHDIYPGSDNPRPPHTLKDNAYPSLSQSMHNTHASTQGPKQCQQQRQDKASNTQAAHEHEHRHTRKKRPQRKAYSSEHCNKSVLAMIIKHVPVNQNRRHKRDKKRGTSEKKTEAQARYRPP